MAAPVTGGASGRATRPDATAAALGLLRAVGVLRGVLVIGAVRPA